ncbi:sugar phosphate isomerase/epimerase [Amycolatopsis rhizosphaerae]|uniref:Sugar phosphate isomerase/epimerase n=1 Tax=Amycolatopsis rhizosphaerae TaxID=2053003 RepID=A0A558CJF3_9PSEU|nr:metabolite traffic protein EboE [Amycolatopsis rhizosphaerae]TVT48887.1 sugar phosphate isomerase/epimerase [Amycolatopsis rhizosphaerae]
MRFRHRDGTLVHVAYCTNVHAAEDLDGVLAQLARFGEPVREKLGADRLGLGLWLARPVASALSADPAALPRLRAELAARGLEVVTLNGFPYRGFHEPVVKHSVYHPHWATAERARYTMDLARVLTALLPEDAARGSVSTLPLTWRTDWSPEIRDTVRERLDRLGAELAGLARETGKPVRVGFEPEPGCVVETTAQAVEHLAHHDTDWLGLCLDTCHLAVAFEQPGEALARLADAELGIVKVQVSCALQADDPSDPDTRHALASFAEPRFLHQCVEGGPPGTDDLGDALTGLPGAAPWRIHFHIPVHADPVPPLRSTRPQLSATLAGLFGGACARTDHVEVETYTWQVLPDAPAGDSDLIAGLAAELDWTRRELLALGLAEEP